MGVAVALFFLLTSSSYCDSGLRMSICGRFVDKNTGLPIIGGEIVLFKIVEGKEIQLDDVYIEPIDSNGCYCIKDLESGFYTISPELPGGRDCVVQSTDEEADENYGITIEERQNVEFNILIDFGDILYVERVEKSKTQIELTIGLYARGKRYKRWRL